jgi:hypothetical protein
VKVGWGDGVTIKVLDAEINAPNPPQPEGG